MRDTGPLFFTQNPVLIKLRRVWIFTDHVFFLGRTRGNIPTCASESDPLDLRRPGVWGRGEAVERQYGHALSSHALHSRQTGLPLSSSPFTADLCTSIRHVKAVQCNRKRKSD